MPLNLRVSQSWIFLLGEIFIAWNFSGFADILLCIVGIIANDGHYFYKGCENFFGMIALCIAAFIEGITFQTSIYLSFKFGHEKYTKLCKRCHVCVAQICYRCVKRKERKEIQNIQNEYIIMESTGNDSQQP